MVTLRHFFSLSVVRNYTQRSTVSKVCSELPLFFAISSKLKLCEEITLMASFRTAVFVVQVYTKMFPYSIKKGNRVLPMASLMIVA